MFNKIVYFGSQIMNWQHREGSLWRAAKFYIYNINTWLGENDEYQEQGAATIAELEDCNRHELYQDYSPGNTTPRPLKSEDIGFSPNSFDKVSNWEEDLAFTPTAERSYRDIRFVYRGEM